MEVDFCVGNVDVAAPKCARHGYCYCESLIRNLNNLITFLPLYSANRNGGRKMVLIISFANAERKLYIVIDFLNFLSNSPLYLLIVIELNNIF